jgi:predicted Zn-ribbon and HTH transcriptional regulator
MSRMTNESGRLPDGERFRDHRTFLQKFGKQILMSIAASLIAGCILNATGILKAVRYASSIVIHTTGDPWPLKGPDQFPNIPRLPHGPIGLPPVKLPNGSPIHKSPEQIEAEEKARKAREAEKAQAERRGLEARAERLKLPYDKEWTLEKLKLEVEDAEQELREAERERQENEKKRPLLARADTIKLLVDKTLPYKTLKEQVEKGEKEYEADAKFQADLRQYEKNLEVREYLLKRGPNARCLNPKCHYQFRTERKSGQAFCPKCRGLFNIIQYRANMPPPPMPMYPKRDDPNLLDRVKGMLGKK